MLDDLRLEEINSLLKKMTHERNKWMSLAIAIDLADEILKCILPDKEEWMVQLSRNARETGNLPDALPVDIFHTQKQYTWFQEHPKSSSARSAFRHFYEEDSILESNFFWFSNSTSKEKISVSTGLTYNWEDNNLTRTKDYKVGIDFFLSSDTESLFVVVTNNHKVRALELKGQLSNTQKKILKNYLNGAATFKNGEENPRKVIHEKLWNALQLKEVNKEFYNIIANHFNSLVETLVNKNDKDLENAKQFSSRLMGRLLFTWFLRKMNIIDEEKEYFSVEKLTSTEYYHKKLKVLFFNVLNTPVTERKGIYKDTITPYLNGGLFEIQENDYFFDRLEFPKDYFKGLYSNFDKFDFTIDESSADFEVIAIDPEMLGQVFESLLASQLKEDGTNERNNTGAFYTPREIVEYMCKETLRSYLYKEIANENFNQGIDALLDWSDKEYLNKKSTAEASLWGVNSKSVISQIKKALDKIKILDPACGSGAYPMGMMQQLLKIYSRIEKNFDIYKKKLSIIQNSIFGVDIQPMAVEISRLRAWLSVIIEEKDAQKIQPLPNLDFKFISANSLIKLVDTDSIFSVEVDRNLEKLKKKYFNARTPKSKKDAQKHYYDIINSTDMFDDHRAKQLKTFDPFKNRFSAAFFDAHYMFGVYEGFDIVIGNPPYIQLQKMDDEMKKKYKSQKYKTYTAKGDIYVLFYENGINLLKENGILAFITSAKWLRSEYGVKLRNYLIDVNPLLLLGAGTNIFNNAVVDTNILIVEKTNNKNELLAADLSEDALNDISGYVKNFAISPNYKEDETWLILNKKEKNLKDKVEKMGTKLRDWNININRGILTGLNEAFIIDRDIKERLIEEDYKSKELIRPLLRGKDIEKYESGDSDKYVICTFPSKNISIEDYPAIKNWLINGEWVTKKTKSNPPTPIGSGKLRLLQTGSIESYEGISFKTRKKTNNAWFETQDAIGYWSDFDKPKMVWKRIGSILRFSLDEKNNICLDSTCIATGEHIPYLVAVLNSKIGNYLLKDSPTTGTGDLLISVQAIEPLSIPIPNKEQEEEIVNLLQKKKYEELEEAIQKIYNLTNEDMEIIESYFKKDLINR